MNGSLINEIKEKIDIVDFISNYVELKKVGSYYRGLCPFHQERNPSFFVSPERQIFKCFGCGVAGDVIAFYAKIENIDFKEAVRRLAEKLGIEIEKENKRTEAELNEIKKILEINRIALNYYKKNLKEIKEAEDYLLKRGLKKEYIDFFDLGYAKEGSHLKDYLFSLGYELEDLEKAGLLNERKEDKFQSRIIFPLIDTSSRIVGFTGRIFPEKEKAPKYLNSPETVLFKKSQFIYGLVYSKDYITKEKEAIILEGQFDFILSFQNGLKNTVAISGSALTKDHLYILKRYTNRLVLGFDNDEAGLKASLRSALMALDLGFEIFKLEFGESKDIAEFFEKGNSKESLKKYSFIDFIFEYVKNNFNLEKLEDKRNVINLLIPFIKRMDNVSKSFYINKLSEMTGIKEEFLINELDKIGLPPIEEETPFTVSTTKRINDLLERFLALSLLLDRKDEIENIKSDLDPEYVSYLNSLVEDSNNMEIINLRVEYEKLNSKDLEREFIILKKEIIREICKEKIEYYKNLINNLNSKNLEEVLKEVKFYIEKLKAVEKNA